MNTSVADAPRSEVFPYLDIAKTFSRAACCYDDYALIQRRIARRALAALPLNSSDKVLDIGCGTGLHTHALAQRASATGVDIAPGMIALASQRYPSIKFIEANARKLPFSDKSFSRLFSSMALQWSDNPGKVMREMYRILAEGGKAELAIMVHGSFPELIESRRAAGLANSLNSLPDAVQWRNSAVTAGFIVDHCVTVAYEDMFSEMTALLRSITKVGAGLSLQPGQRPSLSRGQLLALEAAFPKTKAGEYPLTYRVLHLSLEKI